MSIAVHIFYPFESPQLVVSLRFLYFCRVSCFLTNGFPVKEIIVKLYNVTFNSPCHCNRAIVKIPN